MVRVRLWLLDSLPLEVREGSSMHLRDQGFITYLIISLIHLFPEAACIFRASLHDEAILNSNSTSRNEAGVTGRMLRECVNWNETKW